MEKIKVIFITGPTASGKTNLAIFLAKKFKGEIINADSRQVYQYLDWGSGKVDGIKIKKTKNEVFLKGVRIHLLDIAHPLKNYSLGRWLKDSERAVKEIVRENKLPIFCGGTILYLRALKEGWVLPKVKANFNLRKKLEKEETEILYQKLKKLDPRRAKEIDPQNKRRIIRALEIIDTLGKVPPIKKETQYKLLLLSPYFEKEKLFKKIKRRLIKRVPYIIQEIKKLRKVGLSFKRIISFGLEYEWLGKYVKGEIDLITAKEKCYQDILRLAKRQIREIKKIEGVIYLQNKREVFEIVENFLKN